MYGRDDAGHSDTATGHAAETTTIETPASASCPSRVSSRGGPASTYAAASAGTTIQPWSIFVMNARPTTTPHHSRNLVRPVSIARTTSQAEATISTTSSASGMSTRAIATVIGEIASAAAAASPATGPNTRRTVAYSSATAAIVSSACGSSMLNDENSKARADRPMSQSESGGLSTRMKRTGPRRSGGLSAVRKRPGSSEPKNIAFQLSLADFTAAA